MKMESENSNLTDSLPFFEELELDGCDTTGFQQGEDVAHTHTPDHAHEDSISLPLIEELLKPCLQLSIDDSVNVPETISVLMKENPDFFDSQTNYDPSISIKRNFQECHTDTNDNDSYDQHGSVNGRDVCLDKVEENHEGIHQIHGVNKVPKSCNRTVEVCVQKDKDIETSVITDLHEIRNDLFNLVQVEPHMLTSYSNQSLFLDNFKKFRPTQNLEAQGHEDSDEFDKRMVGKRKINNLHLSTSRESFANTFENMVDSISETQENSENLFEPNCVERLEEINNDSAHFIEVDEANPEDLELSMLRDLQDIRNILSDINIDDKERVRGIRMEEIEERCSLNEDYGLISLFEEPQSDTHASQTEKKSKASRKRKKQQKKLIKPATQPRTSRKRFVESFEELQQSQFTFEEIYFDPKFTCSVCLEMYHLPSTCSPCNHVFCDTCLRRLTTAGSEGIPCPLCRTVINRCDLDTALDDHLMVTYPDVYTYRAIQERNSKYRHFHLPFTPAVPLAKRILRQLIASRRNQSDFHWMSHDWFKFLLGCTAGICLSLTIMLLNRVRRHLSRHKMDGDRMDRRTGGTVDRRREVIQALEMITLSKVDRRAVGWRADRRTHICHERCSKGHDIDEAFKHVFKATNTAIPGLFDNGSDVTFQRPFCAEEIKYDQIESSVLKALDEEETELKGDQDIDTHSNEIYDTVSSIPLERFKDQKTIKVFEYSGQNEPIKPTQLLDRILFVYKMRGEIVIPTMVLKGSDSGQDLSERSGDGVNSKIPHLRYANGSGLSRNLPSHSDIKRLLYSPVSQGDPEISGNDNERAHKLSLYGENTAPPLVDQVKTRNRRRKIVCRVCKRSPGDHHKWCMYFDVGVSKGSSNLELSRSRTEECISLRTSTENERKRTSITPLTRSKSSFEAFPINRNRTNFETIHRDVYIRAIADSRARLVMKKAHNFVTQTTKPWVFSYYGGLRKNESLSGKNGMDRIFRQEHTDFTYYYDTIVKNSVKTVD
ncbi:uncharacterized protein LOC128244122 [Mya arenaria]|uniref:uncharacterized protein LOC128244122 n=1 Tax=Mya arenaria TaxID=6604 RepID=UPI0022E30EEF|nr:uncharacterized protein LOC128244122 [Mya arenaria]